MTDTTVRVTYHVDGYAAPRPAINVKCYQAGHDYRLAWIEDGLPERANSIFEYAYECIVSDFWQAAQEIATQRGLGEIEQQGRSGGWLVFTDGRDPQDAATFCEDQQTGDEHEADVREWLAGYRSMVEWADAFIADAPRKVAALAQQYAMDEAGEEPARRAFAFLFAHGIVNGDTVVIGRDDRWLVPDPRNSWPVDHAEGE